MDSRVYEVDHGPPVVINARIANPVLSADCGFVPYYGILIKIYAITN